MVQMSIFTKQKLSHRSGNKLVVTKGVKAGEEGEIGTSGLTNTYYYT